MQKSPEAVKVGIIGCGNISSAYLQVQKKLEMIDVVAVADLLPERAKAQAEKFGISKAYTVDQILADPDIEMIINLTIPAAHYQVAMQALEAGKSVYNEKPFAAEVDQGKQLIEEANRRGLLVGSAPDTFLGSGLQTARKAIDDGLIGDPI